MTDSPCAMDEEEEPPTGEAKSGRRAVATSDEEAGREEWRKRDQSRREPEAPDALESASSERAERIAAKESGQGRAPR